MADGLDLITPLQAFLVSFLLTENLESLSVIVLRSCRPVLPAEGALRTFLSSLIFSSIYALVSFNDEIIIDFSK